MNLIKYKIHKFKERSIYSILECHVPKFDDLLFWESFIYVKVGGGGYDTHFYIDKDLNPIHKDNFSYNSGTDGYHRVYIFGPKDLSLKDCNKRNNSLCIGFPLRDDTGDYILYNSEVDTLNTILSNFINKLKQHINDNLTHIRS